MSSSMSPRSRTCTSRPMFLSSVGAVADCADRAHARDSPPSHVRMRSPHASSPRSRAACTASARDVTSELAEQVAPVRLRRRLGDPQPAGDCLKRRPSSRPPSSSSSRVGQVRVVLRRRLPAAACRRGPPSPGRSAARARRRAAPRRPPRPRAATRGRSPACRARQTTSSGPSTPASRSRRGDLVDAHAVDPVVAHDRSRAPCRRRA